MWHTCVEFDPNNNTLFDGNQIGTDVTDPTRDGLILTKRDFLFAIEDLGMINNDGEFVPGADSITVIAAGHGLIKRAWVTEESALAYCKLLNDNYPEINVTIEEVSDS
jgi:hypothetical protein